MKFLLFFFFLATSANACLHFEGDNPFEPTPAPEQTTYQRLQSRVSKESWQQIVDERQKIADKEWDFRTQNNLAVALAHVGKLDEARARLETVERTFPGHPYTAYNLATVFELQSNLPLALEWLRKGLARERERSGFNRLDGTEWLHIRILEAALGKNLGAKSVVNLDFGEQKTPTAPAEFPDGVDGKPLPLTQIEKSLFEQLHERLEFVSAPNPIVGDLLFDFANLHALQNEESAALELYNAALEYGTPRQNLLQRRFDYFNGTPNYLLIAALVSLPLCALAWWQFNRLKRERAAYNAMPVQNIDDVLPRKKAVCIEFKDES